MEFKDHFSTQAAEYARSRPHYPGELFRFLGSIAPARQLAWDCATGNGQAATGLAQQFERVIATDASAAQIAAATPDPRIEYRVAPADQSGIASGTVDLVTVAQALHWFDLDAFYAEVKRVLRPGGALATWSYSVLQLAPEIDAIVDRYYHEIVGPYWPPERRIVERGYQDLPFPFAEVASPPLEMVTHWRLAHLLGYLRSWSATQRYLAAKKADPLELILPELRAAWRDPEVSRPARWPLSVRAGFSA